MPFVNKTMTVLIKKIQLFLNIILFIFVIKWQNVVYVFIYLFIYIFFILLIVALLVRFVFVLFYLSKDL